MPIIGKFGVDADPETCTWRPIADFLSDSAYSTATKENYHAALSAWFKWLTLMDYRPDNPMLKLHRPKSTRRTPRPITTEQLEQLLTSGRLYGRTRTMVILAAYLGLRCHEIAKFRGDHIRGSEVRIRGKGGVNSVLPLPRWSPTRRSGTPETGTGSPRRAAERCRCWPTRCPTPFRWL